MSAETTDRILSWVVPSAGDEAAWAGMTREEQLKALQDLARHPDTTLPSEKSVAEILAEARARRQTRGG